MLTDVMYMFAGVHSLVFGLVLSGAPSRYSRVPDTLFRSRLVPQVPSANGCELILVSDRMLCDHRSIL